MEISSESYQKNEFMLKIGGKSEDAAGGCGKDPGQLTPGAETYLNLTLEGHVRDYLVHIPANYNSSKEHPLIFAFHGYVNQATDMFLNGLGTLAD